MKSPVTHEFIIQDLLHSRTKPKYILLYSVLLNTLMLVTLVPGRENNTGPRQGKA